MDDSDNIYDKPLSVNDYVIIYTDKFIVGEISDIDFDLSTLSIDNHTFSINENGNIILKTDTYEIYDIEKVREFDVNDIDKVSKTLTTDALYPRIETEVIVNKIYSKTEKIENLLYILIKNLNIYDNKYLLNIYHDFASDIINLLEKNYDTQQSTNILPDWIVPISSNVIYRCPDDSTELFAEFDSDTKTKSNKHLPYKSVIDTLYDSKGDNIENTFIEHGYELQNYSSDFLRTCIREKTCEGSLQYNIDMRRTRKPYISYKLIDDTYTSYVVKPPKHLHICGFLLLSDRDNIFPSYHGYSINEKSCMVHKNYSPNSRRLRLNKVIDNGDLIDIIVDLNDSMKYDYVQTNSYYFKTDTTYDKSEFQKILYEYLPDGNLLVNSLDKDTLQLIRNYNDLYYLLRRYSINLDKLSLDTRTYVNTQLTRNIDNYKEDYIKKYGLLKFKRYHIVKKKVSIVDRILHLKKLIYKEPEDRKLDYLQKFIDEFTYSKPDDTNLYNKFNNNVLLCEHYKYLIRATNSTSDYDYLQYINEYKSDNKTDGYHVCKYCSEYLSPDVDQTNLIGFDDDGKPNYLEKIEDISDESELEKVDVNQIIGYLITISDIFGISLTIEDTIEIIQTYNNLDLTTFVEKRYDTKNIPKELKDIPEYLKNSSILLYLTIIILLYIQTAVPPYQIRLKSDISLIKLSDERYKTILHNLDIINYELIDSIMRLYARKLRILNIEIFVSDNDLATTRYQFTNTISYLLSSHFGIIQNRIYKYKEYLDISKTKYIKNEWSTFKPHPTNKTVTKVNRLLNLTIDKKYLIKKVGEYSLENVVLVESLEKSETIIKSDQLEISNIEIVRNQSFLRLYSLIISLYGTQPDNIYMNLLIERLSNTDTTNYLEGIFRGYGWRGTFENGINFKDMRGILLKIIEYCKTDEDCRKTLQLFIHKSFNNSRLITLNTRMIRHYSYSYPNIYPIENYTDFPENSNIPKIFELYCYDVNDKIIRKTTSHYSMINPHINVNISMDMCEQKIVASNESFRELIETLHIQNKLPKIPEKSYLHTTESRVTTYITPVLRIDGLLQRVYDLYNDFGLEINTMTEEKYRNYEKDRDKYINELTRVRETMITTLSDYLLTTDTIDKSYKDSLDISKLKKSFELLLKGDTSIFYKKYMKNIIRIVSTIKNAKNKGIVGCYSSNKIIENPDVYKLSHYNVEKLEDFLDKKVLLLHDMIFLNKESDIGFYKYIKDTSNNRLQNGYDDIFSHIYPYVISIDIVVGDEFSFFDKQSELNLVKYLLISLFYKIYEYIEDIKDTTVEEGNELFTSLEQNVNKETKDTRTFLSSLLLDLVTNTIQEHKDSEWVSVLSNKTELTKKLDKEREREKQSLLQKRKNMNPEEKYIANQMNIIGDANMWRDAKRDNEKRVQSDEFDMDIIQERKERDLQLGIDSDTIGSSDTSEVGYDIDDENKDEHDE